MIRIGMIDRWLDNWHTNHYPDYLRLAAQVFGFDMDVTDVWAEVDAPNGGLSTESWCRLKNVRPAGSEEELLERVDAVMVMCADDCLPHERLAQKALACGKPVYCDKTFAPTLEAAVRMFNRAEQHNTPMFTCSAQRYCIELRNFVRLYGRKAEHCSTTGPGDVVNYSIHQFEMLEQVMGTGAVRCQAESTENISKIVYEYDDGRRASFSQGQNIPFTMMASKGNICEEIAVTDYYTGFMHILCKFFTDKKMPVSREDTLEIMAMQQAGRQALLSPGQWIPVPMDRG